MTNIKWIGEGVMWHSTKLSDQGIASALVCLFLQNAQAEEALKGARIMESFSSTR